MKPWVQILLALVLAFAAGALINQFCQVAPAVPTEAEAEGAVSGKVELNSFGQGVVSVSRYVGELFLQALKMIIVPLILSSIVLGIAGAGGGDGFGRRGLKTVGYYALTSAFAIITGLAVVNLVKPGEPGNAIRDVVSANQESFSTTVNDKIVSSGADTKSLNAVGDIFKRMIPENVFEVFSNNSQMLALIFVSILLAIALLVVGEKGRTTWLDFLQAVNEVTLQITKWIMLLMPIGIFGMVTPVIAEAGFAVLGLLAKYFFTVLLALGLHMFVTMPLILALLGRVNPLLHFMAMRNALLTAFSSASSSATLPVTMRAIRENAGVSNRVTSFVLPLGATVNMDGTALYECVAVIFIAQVLGIDLAFSQQLMIVILSLLTSIGVAGVPSASLVAIVIIVENVLVGGGYLASEEAVPYIGLLLVVDRLLDMCRTAVNVFSDSCGAVVVAKSEGEDGILEHPMKTAGEA